MRFDLCNPTRIVFGTGAIARLPELIEAERRVLLLFGGGSIKRNGVYDAVVEALDGRAVDEFGGIEANPRYETIMQAARMMSDGGFDFVLGVGGGSVIDAAKFLATVAAAGDADPWDALASGDEPRPALPNGAILTLPATGSESNPVSVISHAGRGMKLPFANQNARPRFAILDPDTMRSLSRRQVENGVVDAVTHVLEQYLTMPVETPIQHGFSEAILEALIEWGPRLLEEDSPTARETVMWAANQALNGLIGSAVPQDWSTHMIGHAITAAHGLDHARTLSLVMPHLLRHQVDGKAAMLARYGRRVWKIDEADDRKAALAAIDRTEAFFARMGCPVRTADLSGLELDVERVVSHVAQAGQLPLGEAHDIGEPEIRRILAAAAA